MGKIEFIDEIVQKNNGVFPLVDSNNLRGGLYTVETISERDAIPIERCKVGMLCFVKNENKYYKVTSIINNITTWEEAKFGGGGIQSYTRTQLKELEDEGNVPQEYIFISNHNDLNGKVDNNIYTVSKNGTYIDILFLAIRSLLSEVSKLKNTFYYGIQSYNGTNTRSSEMILTEELEEKEPLWALDPEDLSEFEDHSVIIGSDCELTPITNLNIKENCVEIFDEVSQEINLNFDESSEAKLCAYIIADLKENANITINFAGEANLNLNLAHYASRSKCNILLIINRKIFDEDLELYKGKNYIWIQVTDNQGNVINTGYIDNNKVLVSNEITHDNKYYINKIIFNNINLYKCNFYSKSSGFTNDDVLSSLTPNDDFTFRAAHITIRSVATKDTLLQVKNRLMENELVLVESEKQLYIKNKNLLISLSSKTTTDNETMTSEEILNILKEAGYITPSDELNSATLNAIENLTFIHTESGQKFNMSINSDGRLIVDQNVPITPDTWNLKVNDKIDYTKRGAVGHHNLGNLFYQETTIEAPLAIYGNSDDPKAYGDRVRFGSWYTPKKGQTKFGCSHDFIELANSGSVDYPLEGARLFIIKGTIVAETIGDTTSNYLTEATIDKFILTGKIKAGSTYLIRCAKHNGNSFVINVDSYDYEIRKNNSLYSLEGTVAMILLNASDSEDIKFDEPKFKIDATQKDIYYFTTNFYNAADKGSFTTEVRSDLIDCVGFGNPEAFRISGSEKSVSPNALGKKTYAIKDDHIVKDFFELDPSRQGFLSLTTKDFESTGYRLDKINAEYLNLANRSISFPHSDEEAEIVRFTPKASYENKTICTDKTPLDLIKPNMVSCFYGINMQTTRCFAWVSAQDCNEYVWIRRKGDVEWNRFESYKGDSSEISGTNDLYVTTSMNRVKYTQTVINDVYKRLKGVFPGSNYTYTAHKCIVYILSAPTDEPITYEYIVGSTLNNELPNLDKCSNIQTFTLYPSTWKPLVYHISDQQGFEWTEYQVWAAAAKQMLKQINEECNSTTKKFPVLINTGDCTLNGTRYNEWLDYYNAGYCLFDHLEQLNTVGNNDLANAYDHSVLGTGNDEGKSNPYYFHLVNCYELDDKPNYSHSETDTDYAKMWQHPLICNHLFFPATYYNYFDNFGYLQINSELTTDCCKGLFKAIDDSGLSVMTYNLYTGYLENQTKSAYTSSNNVDYSFKKTISDMLDSLSSKNIIVSCHEMPFTVITNDNLINNQTTAKYRVDRSCNGEVKSGGVSHTSLVGSHMNRLHYNSNWNNDDNYWFSLLLQNKGVKLCLGGHKHSYACTYPIYENPDVIKDLVKDIDLIKDYDLSKLFITITDRTGTDNITGTSLYKYTQGNAYPLLRASSTAEIDGVKLINKAVTYFMVQATGYKLKSNKELPSVNQSFSIVRPKTNSDNTAHYSLESPMFATINYFVDPENSDNFYWGISLYRIINIKTTDTKKITEFSSIAYSTLPMITERLILNYSESEGSNENYWYTTADKSLYKFDYTTLGSDRCWDLNDDKVYINREVDLTIVKEQINYTPYTLTVKL